MKKGILTTVLRNASVDSTNNGLSSKETLLVLVGEGIREKIEPNKYEDYLILTEFNFRGDITLRATPASLEGRMTMFGGNYCQCSVSNGNVTEHPIKIFDRMG